MPLVAYRVMRPLVEPEELRRVYFHEFLTSLGASEQEISELINYNERVFRFKDLAGNISFPLSDEPFRAGGWKIT